MTFLRNFAFASMMIFAGLANAGLNDSLQDYVRSGNAIISMLTSLGQNASACGIVGYFVSGRVPKLITAERRQMSIVTANAKKGDAGRAILERELRYAEDGNRELLDGERMMRGSLSTDTPACRQGLASFERLKTLSLAVPAQMRQIIKDL